MKKRFLPLIFVLVLAAAVLLSGCEQRSGINSSSASESNAPASSSEKSSSEAVSSVAESSTSSESSESDVVESSAPSAPSNQQTSESSAVETRPGFTKHSMGMFSLWLADPSVVKENTIFEDDSESARAIATLTSIDPVSDETAPFEQYDQLYSDAEAVTEVNFGDYAGKSYLIQETVSEGGMSGIQNTIIYCIDMDNQMIVLEFYPARGMGGISTQREAFESILDSIQAE